MLLVMKRAFFIESKKHNEPSVFTAENLLREARRQKNLKECEVPKYCVLDPDGDLVEYFIRKKQATLNKCWACYHTKLYTVELEGIRIGILGCAVGSSFAVLVAEQLFVSGCKYLISITSAGIIQTRKRLPKFILIEEAIRDEGTSYHYLPGEEKASINGDLLKTLIPNYKHSGLSLSKGKSWTTDAPYRETKTAIRFAGLSNAVCVEMEAAALYAFAKAKEKNVICFAHLTNTMAQTEGDFEKGAEMGSLDSIELIRHTIMALESKQEQPKLHWEKLYESKTSYEVSWTQEVPETSLTFLHSFNLDKQAKIIDIGGGDSKLVDFLLDEGYKNITVLDISEKALQKAKNRLGERASLVTWVVSDITEFEPNETYDLWHDRATFHFLTKSNQVERYLSIARRSVNGFMTIGTFSEKGPKKCSGLPIKQYTEDTLANELRKGFSKIRCITEDHVTPFKTIQNFLFCSFKRSNN